MILNISIKNIEYMNTFSVSQSVVPQSHILDLPGDFYNADS